MVENKNLLTTEELAEVLNCSTQLIHKLKKNGTIPFVKVGYLVRYNAEDVISSLNKEDNT